MIHCVASSDQYSPWDGVEGEEDVRTWMLCLCSRTEAGSSLDPVIVLRSPAGDPWRLASLSRASSSVNLAEASWKLFVSQSGASGRGSRPHEQG